MLLKKIDNCEVLGLTTVVNDGENNILIGFLTDNIVYTSIFYSDDEMKDLIRGLVRHELRHAFQFNEILNRGLDVNKITEMTSKNGYNKDPMEVDAYKFNDLSKPLEDINKGLDELIDEIINS